MISDKEDGLCSRSFSASSRSSERESVEASERKIYDLAFLLCLSRALGKWMASSPLLYFSKCGPENNSSSARLPLMHERH